MAICCSQSLRNSSSSSSATHPPFPQLPVPGIPGWHRTGIARLTSSLSSLRLRVPSPATVPRLRLPPPGLSTTSPWRLQHSPAPATLPLPNLALSNLPLHSLLLHSLALPLLARHALSLLLGELSQLLELHGAGRHCGPELPVAGVPAQGVPQVPPALLDKLQALRASQGPQPRAVSLCQADVVQRCRQAGNSQARGDRNSATPQPLRNASFPNKKRGSEAPYHHAHIPKCRFPETKGRCRDGLPPCCSQAHGKDKL